MFSVTRIRVCIEIWHSQAWIVSKGSTSVGSPVDDHTYHTQHPGYTSHTNKLYATTPDAPSPSRSPLGWTRQVQLAEVFSTIDLDSCGSIPKTELVQLSEALHQLAPEEKTQELLSRIASNGSISCSEFVNYFEHALPEGDAEFEVECERLRALVIALLSSRGESGGEEAHNGAEVRRLRCDVRELELQLQESHGSLNEALHQQSVLESQVEASQQENVRSSFVEQAALEGELAGARTEIGHLHKRLREAATVDVTKMSALEGRVAELESELVEAHDKLAEQRCEAAGQEHASMIATLEEEVAELRWKLADAQFKRQLGLASTLIITFMYILVVCPDINSTLVLV